MPTFAHDPSRVHPPASAGGYPSIAEEERTSRAVPAPREVVPEPPRTRSVYDDKITLVSIALGESGMPHRVVFVNTHRQYRGQGRATNMLNTALGDMDADGRPSEIYVRNVEPDCDVGRLVAFFARFGYGQADPDPDEPDTPHLTRPAGG
jgi:hypothetical protein